MKKRYFYLLMIGLTVQACAKSTSDLLPVKPIENSTGITLPGLGKLTFYNITSSGAMIKGMVTNKDGVLVINRGVCWSTSPNPTIENNPQEATVSKGSGEFSVQLHSLVRSTTYYIRPYAKNKEGVAYGDQVILKTADIQSVNFSQKPMFIIGSERAFYDVEILSSGGGAVTERGVCWGTEENPTITQNKAAHGANGIGKFRIGLSNLTPQTNYHLRAYAINETGVSYGNNIPFRTIKKGNVTYTFNKANSPTANELAAYSRLQVAIDSAVWYANQYTSATKHVYLNYVPGVATADANNEGWMRFGTNTSYQNIRTMLHEMNHTFGTGTTNWWSQQAISAGKYQLTNGNNMLKLINSDQNAVLSGDSQHWWPYGLNQNSEVSSSWDYVYNCLIIEAMRKDGMTSHSGSYTP